MSLQTDALHQLAASIARREPIDIQRYFTEDFRLDDPGSSVVRHGFEGAKHMMDAIMAIAPDVRFEILDTVEQADRVAVRWRVTGTSNDTRFSAAIVAIYRFVDARIAEDWGISSKNPWRDVQS